MSFGHKNLWALTCLLLAIPFSPTLHAASQTNTDSHFLTTTPVTVLFSNDIHSHFRPDLNAPGLGGITRLSTAIQRARHSNSHSVLVDAGDWGEGGIYYNLNAGAASLGMLEHLGYEMAVVGNHDWFNGPDTILDSYAKAKARFPLLGANLNADVYSRKAEFNQRILPYVVKEFEGKKLAFIGLANYQLIFDEFFAPIKILSPFPATRDLIEKLKMQVDGIIVVSHNSISFNKEILRKFPEINLVIGAHDHKKTLEPVKVMRTGYPDGYLVEAGNHGKFLGQVDLELDSRRLTVSRFRLIQIDSTIPENPETVEKLEEIEKEIESKYGPIFNDEVAVCQMNVTRGGGESLMGNLLTDAYLNYSNADIAMDQINMIYGGLNTGTLNSVDIYNANPAVYSPVTDKSWTLKTFSMTGKTLAWVLNVLYASKAGGQFGIISTAGMQFTYDPLVREKEEDLLKPTYFPFLPLSGEAKGIVHDILIGNKPLNPNTRYKIAAGEGVIRAIRIVNTLIPGAISLKDLKDTEMEDWRILLQHVATLSPLTPEKITIGNRIRSLQPDLALLSNDITWQQIKRTKQGILARIQVTVRNFGATPSPAEGRTVAIFHDTHALDLTLEPFLEQIGAAQVIPSLSPMESKTFEWDNVLVPEQRGYFPVTARINTGNDVNFENDEATEWFKSQ